MIIGMMLLWHGYVQWPFGSDNTVPRTPLFVLLIITTLLLLAGIHSTYPSKPRWLNASFIAMASLLTLTAMAMLQGIALSSEILLTLVLVTGIACCLIYLITGSKHSINTHSVVAALMSMAQMVVLLSIAGVINLSFIESMLVLTHSLVLALLALTVKFIFSSQFASLPQTKDISSAPFNTETNSLSGNRDNTIFDAMGHELRTPMNGVLGLSELLQTTQLSKKQSEYLQTLQSSGNDLNNLINLLANAWKGETSTEMTLYNPQELISNSLSKFASLAELNQIEIISSIDAGVPHYNEGNPAIVALLLESLLGHAFQYIAQNDIVLKVRSATINGRQIICELHLEPASAELHSFDQTKSYKDYKNSTGMNLTLFLALQQYSSASSSPPLFSSNMKHFRFAIDHDVQTDLRHESFENPTFHALQPLKVLIVDDNSTCRRVLAEQCSLLGLNCMEAESGHEALAMVRNELHLKRQLDCIILDQNMPGMKGIHLLERLDEELSETEMPPVIMLSGTSNPPDHEQAQQLGIQSILTKPVTRFTLQKALATSIGKTRQPSTHGQKRKTAEPA